MSKEVKKLAKIKSKYADWSQASKKTASACESCSACGTGCGLGCACGFW